MDLFSQASDNNIYTVSEINHEIKDILEGDFARVSVQGEISNFRPAASGHIYFSIKDEESSISAALFRGAAAKIRNVRLKDGLEVICHGRISVYPPRGSYQLIINNIETVGAGSLQAKFEALKKQLQNEGLFDSDRKREIPRMPKKIAVITSPTGAAIRDVLSVVRRRSAAFDLVVIPSLVQGEGAEAQLLQAMKQANHPSLGAEVILLTRGGGSLEDLWCFNSERLARVIAESRLPVVSAVGHEIDFTIADFVSDYRAPTPSAAAEILTKESEVLMEMVDEYWDRLVRTMRRRVEALRMELGAVQARIRNPAEALREIRKQFQEWSERLVSAMKRGLSDRKLTPILEQLYFNYRETIKIRKSELEYNTAALYALSPVSILERGYAIVQRPDGTYLRNASDAKIGDELNVRLGKGRVITEVTGIGESG